MVDRTGRSQAPVKLTLISLGALACLALTNSRCSYNSPQREERGETASPYIERDLVYTPICTPYNG